MTPETRYMLLGVLIGTHLNDIEFDIIANHLQRLPHLQRGPKKKFKCVFFFWSELY